MKKTLTTIGAGFLTVLAWAPLAFYANRYHVDFSAVAFPSAATILAFLLPGSGLVGERLADEIGTSAEEVQKLSDAATTAKGAAIAAETTAAEDPNNTDLATKAGAARSAANTAELDYVTLKADIKSEIDSFFVAANWLRTGVLYAFISVPVSAVALVIGGYTPQCPSTMDWRAVVGSAAVALLVGTGVGILPMTWRLLGLNTFRIWSDRSFAP